MYMRRALLLVVLAPLPYTSPFPIRTDILGPGDTILAPPAPVHPFNIAGLL